MKRKTMLRFLSCSLLAALLFAAAGAPAIEVSELPKLQAPILVTSLGQAPDGNTIFVMAKRGGATLDYETLAAPERIKDFKVVIISYGVSLKGFGAAGVNLDTELARAEAIKKLAKDNGIKLVGMHIGGIGRRDQMSNRIIENYAGMCDLLIVYKDGNQDGLFTDIAQKGDIPFLELEKLNLLGGALKQMLIE
ncbi:MAG: DUF6305 family protein [Deltaproteobacteria bacterium]|nr:DUF6305 family protein [Deltaproteobacteria bacterium]